MPGLGPKFCIGGLLGAPGAAPVAPGLVVVAASAAVAPSNAAAATRNARFMTASLDDGSPGATLPMLAAAGALTILGKIEAHLAVALGIFAPTFANLDEQEEVHRSARDLGNLLACRRADLLDGLALGAEHDLALALARHIDRL